MQGLIIEEIRKRISMNQIEFAKLIGISERTYRDRVVGKFPNWTVEQLVNIAKLNEGDVRIDVDGVYYDIIVMKVD